VTTTVRITRVDLTPPPGVLEVLDARLPAAERDASPATRVARAAARELLAAALDPAGSLAPAAVEISRRCGRCGHPAHGRPFVVGRDDLSFSVSHSGAVGLVAVVRGGATVGVDVEQLRPRHRLARLAARTLGPAQLARFRAAPEPDRLALFLGAWTAKEAYLKATGVGIATRLTDVPAEPDGYLIRALELLAGYVGAVAVDRPDFAVEYASWAPALSVSDGTAG
jgi:4'-phosphopantetheinyl transferase